MKNDHITEIRELRKEKNKSDLRIRNSYFEESSEGSVSSASYRDNLSAEINAISPVVWSPRSPPSEINLGNDPAAMNRRQPTSETYTTETSLHDALSNLLTV